MSLLDSLQSVLKNIAGKQGSVGTGVGGDLNNLMGKMQNSNVLSSALLGGLLGALTTSKIARSSVGGALLAGGGALLWNKYKGRMSKDTPTGSPQDSQTAPNCEQRAERLVRALIFAAKCDGHIDAEEEQNINREVEKLNLGSDGDALVKKILAEPIDPNSLARSVESPEEALELYALSCAVISIDTFMERNYLDALAKALQIPDDVKDELEKSVKN